MNGREFIRRARGWAAQKSLHCVVTAGRGKGGHQMLQVGDRKSFVQSGEIPPGTYHAMLKQLGIPKDEF